MIIKLTECITAETDKIKVPWNRVFWREWTTRDIYLNTDIIVCFHKCNTYDGVGKDYICNNENFNTLIKLNLTKGLSQIFVQETPEQITKLINKEKNKCTS